VISSDLGLCGGYNNEIFKFALAGMPNPPTSSRLSAPKPSIISPMIPSIRTSTTILRRLSTLASLDFPKSIGFRQTQRRFQRQEIRPHIYPVHPLRELDHLRADPLPAFAGSNPTSSLGTKNIARPYSMKTAAATDPRFIP
jgi:hypothetical protein